MNKRVISKPEEKINIVILDNKGLDIIVKGIAKCHDEDTYNEELGIKIANARAWLKYYEKLAKVTAQEMEWKEDVMEFYQNEMMRLSKLEHLANKRVEEIRAEYEELLKTA